MTTPSIRVTVVREADGTFGVLAPKVGWWSELPQTGTLLGAGSRVGVLHQLHRRFDLVLPEGTTGRAVGDLPSRRVVAVEFGELLFRMAPVDAAEAAPAPASAVAHPAASAGLAPGLHAVIAPTDGVFYRRSSPSAPAFVEIGARVRTGEPLGLVEVMKTFNHILYEGPGLPDEAEIVEIRFEDGADVRAGQVLIVVR